MGTFHVGRGVTAYLHFAFVIYGFIEDIWAHIGLGPVLDQLWEETYL